MNTLLNSNYRAYRTHKHHQAIMMLFTRQLLLVVLLQSFCNAAGTDDASLPIRKRTQHRHSSSNSYTHLRGGSTIRDTDNFDPFIGVPRELSADSLPMHKSTDRNMSLSMPTTSTPTLTPTATTTTTTALVFVGETELPVTFSSTTTPPTPKPTLISTSVMTMEEGAFHVGGGIEVEPATEMPVSSRMPTLPPSTSEEIVIGRDGWEQAMKKTTISASKME
eukprot:scaffold5844_cov71-Skeletonema_dohrnii-CCMP3373.AAC.1